MSEDSNPETSGAMDAAIAMDDDASIRLLARLRLRRGWNRLRLALALRRMHLKALQWTTYRQWTFYAQRHCEKAFDRWLLNADIEYQRKSLERKLTEDVPAWLRRRAWSHWAQSWAAEMQATPAEREERGEQPEKTDDSEPLSEDRAASYGEELVEPSALRVRAVQATTYRKWTLYAQTHCELAFDRWLLNADIEYQRKSLERKLEVNVPAWLRRRAWSHWAQSWEEEARELAAIKAVAAATRIQSIQRGRVGREAAKVRHLEVAAATRIQSVQRGRVGREAAKVRHQEVKLARALRARRRMRIALKLATTAVIQQRLDVSLPSS